MKVSLIATVYNEEKLIIPFLESIFKQTKLPDEIIIVDGGSMDSTASEISKFKSPVSAGKTIIKLIFKKGNRSVGRNEAIKRARNEIIAISDAGNILDKKWFENITQPFSDTDVDVVAGYYKGFAKNVFQRCLIPYALVMEDKIDENEFLPATRSMAIKKSIWIEAGKFDEKLSHNEDYAFANKLKEIGAKIVFKKNAVVNWIPRKNLRETLVMFFRFALGDVQANIIRDKVIYIFLRYLLALYLLFIGIVFHQVAFWTFYLLILGSYVGWAIFKSYKYVKNLQALIFLPLIQLISDIAVMAGTLIGLIEKFSLKNILKVILSHKALIFIILIYVATILPFIEWGIPNLNHPFNYHMDEWHFSQAIRAFVRFGTGSVSGAANIPLYHIVSSIIFITPFYLLHIVNPFLIKTSIDNIPIQHTFFEILRLHTLFYGVISVCIIYAVLKKYINKFSLAFAAIFALSPLWIFLSNFYKYDITLVFWIITTVYFILKFYRTEKFNNFIFAGIACGLALSTKFTALPLFAGYVMSYFIFTKKIIFKQLILASFISISIFCFVGIPDTIFGKGSYSGLLYANLIQDPQAGSNINLQYPAWFYLLFVQYPAIFGHFLTGLTYLSTMYFTLIFAKEAARKKLYKYKIEIFIYSTFLLFLVSLLSFNLGGSGNRALVLLPFMTLISAMFIKNLINEYIQNRACINLIVIILIMGVSVQIFQSFAWVSVKLGDNPRITSSQWMLKNIKQDSLIGIENIPIYQNLPDVVLREFYLKEHNKLIKNTYNYVVVSALSKNLPKIVVVTQDYDDVDYLKVSPKKDLVRRLKETGYKKIAVFAPNLRYYDLVSDRMTFLFIYATPLTISFYEKY